MDRTQQKTDKLLSDVYKECAADDDSKSQELQFLDTVLNFLNRRSSILAHPGTSNKVRKLMHAHIEAAKKRELQTQSLNAKKSPTKTSGMASSTKKSVSEREALAMEEKEKQKEKSAAAKAPASKTVKMPANTQSMKKEYSKKMDVDKSADSADGDGDEETETESEKPIGNGGTTDKYRWTQSLDEVEVIMDVDGHLRGKHLSIAMTKSRLSVSLKGKEATPLLDGELHEGINVDESTWTLTKDGNKETKTLTITMQKIKGMCWWKRVIVGDDEIDTAKIEPENSKLDSLDDETRQTVEKMMFDQRQKMKGLPTSKEMEQNKILENFKKQHPEMDFSQMKMGGGMGGGGGMMGGMGGFGAQ